MGDEPEVESEIEIEVEDFSTEIDESENDFSSVNTTVIVETPEVEESSDTTDAVTETLLQHESRISALEVFVAGLAVEQVEDEITDELQSDAIDETAEVVQEETNTPQDEMPASKRHRWWGS